MVCLDFLSLDRTLCSPFLRGARDFVAARVPAETEQGGPRPVAGPGSTPSLQGLGCTSLWLWAEWAWVTPHLSCINNQARCRICHTRKSTSALPPTPELGDQRILLVTQPACLAVRSEVTLCPQCPCLVLVNDFIIESCPFTSSFVFMWVVKMRRISWELVLPFYKYIQG